MRPVQKEASKGPYTGRFFVKPRLMWWGEKDEGRPKGPCTQSPRLRPLLHTPPAPTDVDGWERFPMPGLFRQGWAALRWHLGQLGQLGQVLLVSRYPGRLRDQGLLE